MAEVSTIVEVIPAEKLGHYNGGVQGCLRLATLCEFKLRRLVFEKKLIVWLTWGVL